MNLPPVRAFRLHPALLLGVQGWFVFGISLHAQPTSGSIERRVLNTRSGEFVERARPLPRQERGVSAAMFDLLIARTYLSASDPPIAKRTWQVVMDEMGRAKRGPTKTRLRRKRLCAEIRFTTIRGPVFGYETLPAYAEKSVTTPQLIPRLSVLRRPARAGRSATHRYTQFSN